jgi:hypothetical protein
MGIIQFSRFVRNRHIIPGSNFKTLFREMVYETVDLIEVALASVSMVTYNCWHVLNRKVELLKSRKSVYFHVRYEN